MTYLLPETKVVVILLIVAIPLTILHFLKRNELQQLDITPYIGTLTYPKLFVLSPVQREEGRVEKFIELLGGMNPVRFGMDVAAKRIDLLQARAPMPAAYDKQAIRSLAFSPDLRFLMAANYDNTIETSKLTLAAYPP